VGNFARNQAAGRENGVGTDNGPFRIVFYNISIRACLSLCWRQDWSAPDQSWQLNESPDLL